MNEFHTKMIEREARKMVEGMRRHGIMLTKEDYLDVLKDLIEISEQETRKGRLPLDWLISN
jgi:flagellar motor component MotA